MVAPFWILPLLGIPALIWGVFQAPEGTMNILGLLTFFGGLMMAIVAPDAPVALKGDMVVFSGLCFVAAAIRGRTDYAATKKDCHDARPHNMT
jgi:hypothetical protein